MTTWTKEDRERAKEKYRALLAADEAWQAQLTRTFGRGAGDARYTKAGRGEPGTALRAAHDAHEAARRSHDVLPRDLQFLGVS